MTDIQEYKKLEDLLNKTTAIKIEYNNEVIKGTDTYESHDDHPSQLRFKEPTAFNSLKPEWKAIWASFGDEWSAKRQYFRLFYNESNAFFQSYKLFQANFEEFVPLGFVQSPTADERMELLAFNCELALRSMYERGKHAFDVMKKIGLQTMDEAEIKFCNRYSETRNKFLIHYLDATGYSEFIFDASYWSTMGTSSLLKVNMHLSNQEQKYVVYINFRLDYFKLEKIIISYLKKFSKS